jgi:hypothetical protein
MKAKEEIIRGIAIRTPWIIHTLDNSNLTNAQRRALGREVVKLMDWHKSGLQFTRQVITLTEEIIRNLSSSEDQEVKSLGEMIAWLWENDLEPVEE